MVYRRYHRSLALPEHQNVSLLLGKKCIELMRAAAFLVALKRCTLFTQLYTDIRLQPSVAFRSFTDLAQASVGYDVETIEQIRSRIFGTRIGNGLRSGAKLLRRKLVGHKVANYYLKPIAKNDPMFVDMRAEA